MKYHPNPHTSEKTHHFYYPCFWKHIETKPHDGKPYTFNDDSICHPCNGFDLACPAYIPQGTTPLNKTEPSPLEKITEDNP